MKNEELKEQVPAEEVKEAAPAEEPVKKPAKKASEAKVAARVVAGCKLLNVRKEPSLDAPVVGVLREGNELLVSKNGSTNEFYKISANGLTGYCKKDFIELAKAANPEDKEA